MKPKEVVLFSTGVFFLFSVLAISQQKAVHKYVGTKICAPCHKGEKKGNVHEIWLKSKHAQAFKTLEGEKSAKIAKEKSLSKPASQSPECLKCHAPTHGLDKSLFNPTFDAQQGVQCETCHGPGNDYKSIPVMKDRAKAVAAGLIVWKDEKAIAQSCQKCHNEESPTYKGFKFEELWPKIKHAVPKQG